MKTPNNLSGIYFRYKNPESGTFENWCFEDLPQSEQEQYIVGRSSEWHKSMIIKLAATLKRIGDQFGIVAQEEV